MFGPNYEMPDFENYTKLDASVGTISSLEHPTGQLDFQNVKYAYFNNNRITNIGCQDRLLNCQNLELLDLFKNPIITAYIRTSNLKLLKINCKYLNLQIDNPNPDIIIEWKKHPGSNFTLYFNNNTYTFPTLEHLNTSNLPTGIAIILY